MTRKWTTKYGIAAVLVAVLIISMAIFANPNSLPITAQAKSSFAVMLTDPPNVPAGTSLLNMTYSDISLDVIASDGTSSWVDVGSSGTVNLFSLVNMSQTIASTSIPTNSSVDKIQFKITGVTAIVNDTLYNVTTLSNTLVLNVANPQVNQTLSGVLIDFNPTLVQIQSTDANGNPVNYYVLVPSATATIVNGLDQAQAKVGTIVHLGQNARGRISRVVEDFSQNVTIQSATLSVDGNTTSLSVTVQNQGDVTFRIFGLTVQGNFSSTGNFAGPFAWPNGPEGFGIRSVPFQINYTSLVPMFGIGPMMQQPMIMPSDQTQPMIGADFGMRGMNLGGIRMPFFGRGHPDQPAGPKDGSLVQAASTYLTLAPGQTATLTFSNVIALQNGGIFFNDLGAVVTPIIGNTYTVSLMGEGFQSYQVTATS